MKTGRIAWLCTLLLTVVPDGTAQSVMQVLPGSLKMVDSTRDRGWRSTEGPDSASTPASASGEPSRLPRRPQYLEPMKVSIEMPLEDIQEGVLFVPSLVGSYYKSLRFMELQVRVASQAPVPAPDYERTASRIIARGGVGNFGAGAAIKLNSRDNNPGMLLGLDAGAAWQSRMEIDDTTVVPFFFFGSYGIYATGWFGPLALSYERRYHDVADSPSDRVSRMINGSWTNALTVLLHIHPEESAGPYLFMIRLSQPDFISKITEDNFEFRLIASRRIELKI